MDIFRKFTNLNRKQGSELKPCAILDIWTMQAKTVESSWNGLFDN